MKNKILFFLIILNCQWVIAQVTKLPMYAILERYDGLDIYQNNYQLDTLLPRGGARIGNTALLITDSVRFTYDQQGRLVREDIFRRDFRFADEYVSEDYRGTAIEDYKRDTSRYYRIHTYDDKGRKVSVRHYQVYGKTKYNCTWLNDCEYVPIVVQIDSAAYDSYDNLSSRLTYETVLDRIYFGHPKNRVADSLKLIVKNTYSGIIPFKTGDLDVDRTYDILGRIVTEKWYTTFNGKRSLRGDADGTFDFEYRYEGNSKKMVSRRSSAHHSSNGFAIIIDSSFVYDAKGRVLDADRYLNYNQLLTDIDGFQFWRNVTLLTAKHVDGGVYLDNEYSYQVKRNQNCGGQKFYPNGKLHFEFYANLNEKLNLCAATHTRFSIPHSIHHYQFDSEGNILNEDSILQGNYARFDTISYYDFRPLKEVLAIQEGLYKNKDMVVLELYPNPAQTWVRVGGLKVPTNVQIFGMDGQLIRQEEVTSNMVQIDISDIPLGVYILQANGQRKKMIKTE